MPPTPYLNELAQEEQRLVLLHRRLKLKVLSQLLVHEVPKVVVRQPRHGHVRRRHHTKRGMQNAREPIRVQHACSKRGGGGMPAQGRSEYT